MIIAAAEAWPPQLEPCTALAVPIDSGQGHELTGV